MRTLLHLCLACFLSLLWVPAASADSMSAEEARSAIRAVGNTWRELYRAGRYGEIPELYTRDTLVMPRGRPAIVGREGMRKAVGGLAAGRKVDIDVREREIILLDDHAFYVGDFTVTYTPPEGDDRRVVTEEARSVVLFRQDKDGAWRIHRDIDSPAAHLQKKVESRYAAAPLWNGSDRATPTRCDRLASSKYDRQRLADPKARDEIDVPTAIKRCVADLKATPQDPRLHFHLGRLYGYAGDTEKSRYHRQMAAQAGNHNAIFLLGYLDWIGGERQEEKCQAAADMLLAAQRGNYSAQVTYSAYYLDGKLTPCDTPSNDEIDVFLDKAQQRTDGYFERLLVRTLQKEAASDEE